MNAQETISMPMREALRGRPSVPGRGGFPDRPQARTRRGRVPAGLFRGAFAAVFSAVLLGPALPAARAEEPTPPWKFDDSPKRAVFRVATGQPFVVVRLPAVLPGGATVSAVRAATAQEDRPCHVLVVSRDGIDVLVDCTDLGTNTPVALYLVPGDVPPPVTDSPFSDPLPVRVEVRHAGGHDIPPSSDGLRFLLDRQLGGPFLFALPAFGPVESTPPNNWYRGGWERPAYVAKLESWLVVPEAGAYAFSLGDVAPSYLAVDGVERVARARDAALHPNDWTEGEPFRLEPGLHRVEILSICERAIRMKVGWLPPGAKEFEPIPPARLASGGRTTPLRFETRYDILHAAFTGRPGPAYAFRGSNALFTPVRLKSSTAFWGEGAVTCEWTGEGGRALGTGDAILAIVSGTGDIPVTLRARATTPNGSFESVATDVIPLPFVPAREYLVAGRLAGIPAVCYEDDPVRPELHVRSTASPGVDLEARAVLRSPSGETATFSAPLQLVQTWGRLQIPPRFARDIASLEWEVLHAGAVIASGAAVFHRAPFAEAPAALDGDLLTDASGAVSVLVAPRASAGETADSASVGAAATGLPAGGAPAAIFLDGFFLSGDAVTEGTAAAAMPPGPAGETPSPRVPASPALPAGIRRIRLADLPSSRDGGRFSRLAAIADIETLRGASTILFAPGVAGLADGETPAEFECRLAAFAALARDVLHARVILVTPPAGTVRLPGNGGTGADTGDPDRLVASIIVRVADATGAAVADAYTISRTSTFAGPAAVSAAIRTLGF